jgi:hypothetical protein
MAKFEEKSPREQFNLAINEVAMLSTLAINVAVQAVDLLQDVAPQKVRFEIKKICNNIESGAEQVAKTIRQTMINDRSNAWLTDFINAVDEYVQPDVLRLRIAIENVLRERKKLAGRKPDFAALVITAVALCYFADETTDRFKFMDKYTYKSHDGYSHSAYATIRSLRPTIVEKALEGFVSRILMKQYKITTEDMNLRKDKRVKDATTAILNRLRSEKIYAYAFKTADRLNGYINGKDIKS